MRRTFRLLKDTPELKAGAIVREKCDNGDQGFETINLKEYSATDDQYSASYTRNVVLKGSEWFEEVFLPESLGYLTRLQLDKLKRLLKSNGKKT